jgi:hypothetical protein
MGKNRFLGAASMLLAGLTLAGCQSSDSGSRSRLWSRQTDSPSPKQPMNNYASTMPGAKPLGISDTNNRPGMVSPSNGVQQTSAMQSASSTSSGQSPASAFVDNSSSMGTGPSFDQGGQVVSRPMANPANPAPSSGPVPPPPPSGYTIPAPSAYTPPANSIVPTRKPGDDL